MNIPRKYQLMAVVGIAIIFLLYGIAGLLFKFEIDKEIEKNASFILMMAAALIIFIGKKRQNNEKDRKIPDESSGSVEADDGKKKTETSENQADSMKM